MPLITTLANASISSLKSVGSLKSIVSGGTLTSDDNYYYRTFTANDTLSITGNPLTADVLLVAGGGGAGWDAGGGGGGGGVIIALSKILSIDSHSLVIGNGGTHGQFLRGTNGGNTTAFGLAALGGGGGGYYGNAQSGLNGGSGGGGASVSGTAGSATQSSGDGYTGYGYNGGAGGSSHYGSGGGGGAGGTGATGIANTRVSGGAPLYSTNFNSSGTSIAYSGGGYGNADSDPIYDTGRDKDNNLIGYYGFGANGMGLQSEAKSGNPGIIVVKYSKSQVA
jgi:hypothetical protein